MTFTSLEFAALLLITFSIYYFLPQRLRMVMLVIASYTFYCFWNPMYGLLIFASTILDYSMARAISASSQKRTRKQFLLISIIGNLGLLGYFKYTNFALDSLQTLLGPLGLHLAGSLEILIPVGISFYTFQTMSYTIDVYRGTQKAEKDILLVSLFVCFFPQLVAGPIERANMLMPQLARKQPFSFQNIETGIKLICWGLLKKIVVADRLAYAASQAFIHPESTSTGVLAFSATAMFVVVYLDFSAYSEIARGTASLFGIKLSRNFLFPHAALNIAEYWRRWHISMSSWVRDYLFQPLGGFKIRQPLSYAKVTLITMGLVGLWHGANWTFVLWGLGNGICLFCYHLFALHVMRRKRMKQIKETLPWVASSWVFSMTIRIMLSILFFSPDLSHALTFYKRLCFQPTTAGFTEGFVLAGFTVIALFWTFHFMHEKRHKKQLFMSFPPAVRGAIYSAISFIVFLGGIGSSEPFIYFQF